ncbi:unannotated protein [freshwater metagenome]|uniref:Unannotated protein n=1 Tax=freshwater metagenome TaxID=449393 RepID=A0A6J7E1Q4_9ZZZZ
MRSPGGVDCFEFITHEPVRHRRGARTAVAIDVHSEHPEFTHLADELAAKSLNFEVFIDLRLNPLEREFPGLVAPAELVRGEQCIESHDGFCG